MYGKNLDEKPGSDSEITLVESWNRVSLTQQKAFVSESNRGIGHAPWPACMKVRRLKDIARALPAKQAGD